MKEKKPIALQYSVNNNIRFLQDIVDDELAGKSVAGESGKINKDFIIILTKQQLIYTRMAFSTRSHTTTLSPH